MRFLEQSSSDCEVQLAFSALPRVSPVVFAQRAKGRLQNDLRKSSLAFPGFSRKVSVRSIGENSRQQVEDYIDAQVGKERFVDSRFEADVRQFAVRCPEVDLSQPTESAHGRYWYNLHLVLVAAERNPTYDTGCLAKIRDGCFAIARKKGHRIGILSVLPTHVHIAMRGNIKHSPQEIALGFQNNLAYLLGQIRIWRAGYYVGTFSEYDMGAIRARVRCS
jgi:REP element-mobilizing transposase RayT